MLPYFAHVSITTMSYNKILLILSLFILNKGIGQDYWQQRVDYAMDVRLDVKSNKVTGSQKLIYTNNSRDTLIKVYYHLYFNAFQPNSMMDVRSRAIADPDPRVGDRISKLTDDEIGYQHILNIKQDGKDVNYSVDGTIMEVKLNKPILPNAKTTFELKFESQVPIQIRRSGRNSKEGIAYSMTQWYPKLAEYDKHGWHADQYVAREFHGVWGDFDVKITIDPTFVIGGTGKLQNPDKIGYAYEKTGTKIQRSEGELTWHFIAKNVIDFAWAADPDYVHDQAQVPDGPTLHFFYQKGDKTTDNWAKMQEYAVKHFQFMNKTFGKYPYDSYSIIQGGDGGMEYPMCTLITGERSFGSLVGVMAHEASHSWFQAVIATNETLYPWMDEGFTDFSSNESMHLMFNETTAPHQGSYNGYFGLVKSGLQEPASQPSDHYNTNRAYGVVAYNMGSIFLHQLKYIIGEVNFYKGMRAYYASWKFKHPEPSDFIRIMEKTSGLELDWYLNYWINSTKRIDYSIKSVIENEGATFLTVDRLGDFPMPVDLMVTLKDGSKELYYIPLNETLGGKPVEDETIQRFDLEEWPWVNPSYTLKINHKANEISLVEIDPTQRMADIERKNNQVDLSRGLKAYKAERK
jgi:hypothetical protein